MAIHLTLNMVCVSVSQVFYNMFKGIKIIVKEIIIRLIVYFDLNQKL